MTLHQSWINVNDVDKTLCVRWPSNQFQMFTTCGWLIVPLDMRGCICHFIKWSWSRVSAFLAIWNLIMTSGRNYCAIGCVSLGRTFFISHYFLSFEWAADRTFAWPRGDGGILGTTLRNMFRIDIFQEVDWFKLKCEEIPQQKKKKSMSEHASWKQMWEIGQLHAFWCFILHFLERLTPTFPALPPLPIGLRTFLLIKRRNSNSIKASVDKNNLAPQLVCIHGINHGPIAVQSVFPHHYIHMEVVTMLHPAVIFTLTNIYSSEKYFLFHCRLLLYCHAKANGGICLLSKSACTVFWLCRAVLMSVSHAKLQEPMAILPCPAKRQ